MGEEEEGRKDRGGLGGEEEWKMGGRMKRARIKKEQKDGATGKGNKKKKKKQKKKNKKRRRIYRRRG